MSVTYTDGAINLDECELIAATLGLFPCERVRQLVERLSNSSIGRSYDLLVQVYDDGQYGALYVKCPGENLMTTKAIRHLVWMRGYISGAMGEMN